MSSIARQRGKAAATHGPIKKAGGVIAAISWQGMRRKSAQQCAARPEIIMHASNRRAAGIGHPPGGIERNRRSNNQQQRLLHRAQYAPTSMKRSSCALFEKEIGCKRAVRGRASTPRNAPIVALRPPAIRANLYLSRMSACPIRQVAAGEKENTFRTAQKESQRHHHAARRHPASAARKQCCIWSTSRQHRPSSIAASSQRTAHGSNTSVVEMAAIDISRNLAACAC